MSRKVCIRPVAPSTSEYLQPMTSAASSDIFADVCASVESRLAGVDVDVVSDIIAVVEDLAVFKIIHIISLLL